MRKKLFVFYPNRVLVFLLNSVVWNSFVIFIFNRIDTFVNFLRIEQKNLNLSTKPVWVVVSGKRVSCLLGCLTEQNRWRSLCVSCRAAWMSQRIQQERSLFVLLRVNFCRMQLTYPATPPHLQAWNLLSHSHLACLHLQTFFFKFIYKYYFLVAYKETLFLIKQSSFLFRLRCFFFVFLVFCLGFCLYEHYSKSYPILLCSDFKFVQNSFLPCLPWSHVKTNISMAVSQVLHQRPS